MQRVYNVNIEAQHPLPTPQEIHEELPLRPGMEDFVEKARGETLTPQQLARLSDLLFMRGIR